MFTQMFSCWTDSYQIVNKSWLACVGIQCKRLCSVSIVLNMILILILIRVCLTLKISANTKGWRTEVDFCTFHGGLSFIWKNWPPWSKWWSRPFKRCVVASSIALFSLSIASSKAVSSKIYLHPYQLLINITLNNLGLVQFMMMSVDNNKL